MEEKHNINEALKYYRYYAAFCENAIDAMEWYLDDYRITSQAKSITESRLLSLQLKAHMDKALDTYRELCDNGSCIRKYNIIMRKFIDPQGGADGRGKPFTNEQLADINKKPKQKKNPAYKKKEVSEVPKVAQLGTCSGKGVREAFEELLKDEITDTTKQLEKPPLGLRPSFIWMEERLTEILEAAHRYVESKKDIPYEWMKEYIEILIELDKRETA